MRFRQFDPHIESIALSCRGTTFTNEPFEIVDPARQGGGTGAVKVKMQVSGLEVWAKPEGKGDKNLKDPGHEKIASDLAHEFGLPVAPVVLSKQTANMNLHGIVALSYPALTAGRPWHPNQTSETLAQLRPALSAMFVFLALLDDHDHMGGANTHYEIVNGVARLSYFDFSHGLTREWKIPGPPPDRPCWKAPNAPYSDLDRAAMEEILQRMEGFPVKDLERIIAGIPPDCLTQEVQAHLVQALDQRRRELRRVLNLTGAS